MPSIILSEVSRERKYCMNSLILGIFFKKFKNKLMKKRLDLWLPEAKGGVGKDWRKVV